MTQQDTQPPAETLAELQALYETHLAWPVDKNPRNGADSKEWEPYYAANRARKALLAAMPGLFTALTRRAGGDAIVGERLEPTTDDVRAAIHRLTDLANMESEPPAITKAMIWSYLHGQRDLAQREGMKGWKNTAPRPSIPMIEAAEREGFLASAAIILWSAMHAAAPHVAVYRTTFRRQTDEGLEVGFSHRTPTGDQGSIAVGQAKQASQIGNADAGEIGEGPPMHGEAERVSADHQYKPNVCECGERFCTGSELTWHQVQRHGLMPQVSA